MKKEKIIAMYLPQFHQIPENDLWWGEGFTDWEAVKAGIPLFDGHIQPKKPYGGNYYNLLDKSTMQWQSQLMKEYGVDGLCFYHYYFKDGRKILEKPTENLLGWKDVDMPYCFCWANESWARTWSNIQNKNTWIARLEKADGQRFDEKGILLEQKYGREEDWEKHFDYLLPFFRDDRYIKVDGAPVFLFYKPEEIYCLPQMVDYWRELAVRHDIPNLYFIGLNSLRPRKGLDAVLINAPTMFFNPAQKGQKLIPCYENGVKMYHYDDIWNEILSSLPIEGYKTFFGGLVNSDGTPRHGKNVTIVKDFSVEKFKNYLQQLLLKNRLAGNEFVFINAWNEWGEGAYLEPDEEYGFQYLEAVRDVQRQVEEAVFIVETERDGDNKKSEICNIEQCYKLNKNKLITDCLDKWMSLKERGISLVGYLKKYQYGNIAIYGFGMLGRHLIFEFKRECVNISYIIERRKDVSCTGIEIKSPEEDFKNVDAVIVTAVADYDEIYEDLKGKLDCPIISILEILSELDD